MSAIGAKRTSARAITAPSQLSVVSAEFCAMSAPATAPRSASFPSVDAEITLLSGLIGKLHQPLAAGLSA